MEYHKDQHWAPCYLFSMSMIFLRSSDLVFSILFTGDKGIFNEGHLYAEVIKILYNELLKVSDRLLAIKLIINWKKSHNICTKLTVKGIGAVGHRA